MNIPTIEELDRIAAKAAGLPVGSTDKWFQKYAAAIRDAMIAACLPQLRPIAEMPAEVPEGHIRKFTSGPDWLFSCTQYCTDTHYIDIALPSPVYPDDFEAAFAESGLDASAKDTVFQIFWKKGGAK